MVQFVEAALSSAAVSSSSLSSEIAAAAAAALTPSTAVVHDGCDDSCGWAAVVVAAIAYGCYGIPIKETSSVDVHPLVLQSYKTCVMFCSCWCVILVGVVPRFTPWGLISGTLWICGGTGGVLAIRKVGMSTAVGTWASVMIAVNFFWGFVMFREPVANYLSTAGAFTCLTAGLIGMSRYGAANHRHQQQLKSKSSNMKSLEHAQSNPFLQDGPLEIQMQQQQQNQRRTSDAENNNNNSDAQQKQQQQQREEDHHQPVDKTMLPAEKHLNGHHNHHHSTAVTSEQKPTTTKLQLRTSPRQPQEEQQELLLAVTASSTATASKDEESNNNGPINKNDENNGDMDRGDNGVAAVIANCDGKEPRDLLVVTGTTSWSKRAVGIAGAVCSGIMTGSSLVPVHYAKRQGFGGLHYIVSFATGAVIANIAIWIVIFWFRYLRHCRCRWGGDGKTNENHVPISALWHTWNTMPAWHVRKLWRQGFMAGLLLSTAMFSNIVVVTYLGQGIGNSAVQSKILISGLIGIFYYKEVTGCSTITKWFMAACLSVFGIVWLGRQRMAAAAAAAATATATEAATS